MAALGMNAVWLVVGVWRGLTMGSDMKRCPIIWPRNLIWQNHDLRCTEGCGFRVASPYTLYVAPPPPSYLRPSPGCPDGTGAFPLQGKKTIDSEITFHGWFSCLLNNASVYFIYYLCGSDCVPGRRGTCNTLRALGFVYPKKFWVVSVDSVVQYR